MSQSPGLRPTGKAKLTCGCLLVLILAAGACATQSTWMPFAQPLLGQYIGPLPTQVAVPGVPPGQPTFPPAVQPTLAARATVPSAVPTTRPAQTTSAPTSAPLPTAVALPPGAPEVWVGIVNYAPYHDVVGAAASTGPTNGVRIVIYDLTNLEERQCDWVQNKAPDQYFPPLPDKDKTDPMWRQAPAGVQKVLASTHSSTVLCPGTDVKLWIGQSAGNDVIVGRPGVNTINDICLRPIAGTAFGSVSEGFVKTLCKSAGLTVRDFRPENDADPAREAWRADQSIPSVVLWEPVATEATDCKNSPTTCVQGAEYKLTSKVFFGIFDVWMAKTGDYSDGIYLAMLSTYQFQDFAISDPEKAYNLIVDYVKAHKELDGILSGYNSIVDWAADRDGEALMTWRDNLTFASIAKDIPASRLHDIQEIFKPTYLPTYKRGAAKPFEVPNVSADSLFDTRYILKLKDDPRIQRLNALPTTRPVLTQYAPPGDKTKVILNYDYLDVKFVGSTNQLDGATKAQDELAIKVVPILKLTPFVFSINYTPDAVGQARAQIVQNLLTQILAVPANRVVLTPSSGTSGSVTYTLLGSSGAQ